MRSISALAAALAVATLSGCDSDIIGSSASQDSEESQQAPAPVDLLTATKATGTIVYQGGSLGVEVLRPLEAFYTQTGAVTIMGTLVEPTSSGKTAGASFAVSTDAEKMFSGKTIKIKVVTSAKKAGEAALAYSTNEVGNSGWVPFPVTTEDSVAEIEFAVPPMVEGLGDFVGIDPKDNEVTIKAIVVETIG
jgi:hypothetical protein